MSSKGSFIFGSKVPFEGTKEDQMIDKKVHINFTSFARLISINQALPIAFQKFACLQFAHEKSVIKICR